MGKSLATRIIQILFLVLFGLSIVLAVLFTINTNGVLLLVYTYTLFGIALGTALIFGILNMFKSKKSMISSLIVLGIFGALLLISYLMSSDAIPHFIGVDEFNVTAAISKWIGTALYMLYIMMGVSVVGLIFSEIRGALK
jgi:hypothetical protein